jgi:hypothetical protein
MNYRIKSLQLRLTLELAALFFVASCLAVVGLIYSASLTACVAWIQWKTRGQRYRELRRLNVPERSAGAAVCSPKGPWRLSFSKALHRGFTKARFRRLGLPPMETLVDA